MIHVYNIHNEDRSSEECCYYCGRSKSGNPLGNPFTFNGSKNDIAKLSFKTREEAIEAYRKYFNLMYGKDEDLTKAFDEIYKNYKAGKEIWLGCFCKPNACHCDIIAEELQKKLIKEKLKEKKEKKEIEKEMSNPLDDDLPFFLK